MTDNDLEAGISVEHAAQDEPDALGRGFHRKTPGGAQDAGVFLYISLVVGLDDRGTGQSRVDVERHVEGLRPFIDRPEPLVVVKYAGGQAVDHRALEAELADRAFQFIGRSAR